MILIKSETLLARGLEKWKAEDYEICPGIPSYFPLGKANNNNILTSCKNLGCYCLVKCQHIHARDLSINQPLVKGLCLPFLLYLKE